MDPRDVVRRSKRLSSLLRHAPVSGGLTLDAAGWVDVDALLAALGWTRAELETVVATDDENRFALDETGTRIRAGQGHSVAVDLGYAAQDPPPVLFHGTAERNLPAIEAEGLRPGRRHAVHLSPDEVTARRVGARHGRPVDAGFGPGRRGFHPLGERRVAGRHRPAGPPERAVTAGRAPLPPAGTSPGLSGSSQVGGTLGR